MLADALYCNYFLIATQMAAGVDVLFKQNGLRITDFRRGQSLGTRDYLVRWPKPAARPKWMTPEHYAGFPDAITVREVKVAHQVLVTTLIEHRQVSKDDLSALYARRWNVELDLRNLKTTTGRDVLSCQTPQMNEKQLWVHLLAYNLIRMLMAQAASNVGMDPRALSFKHTVQLCTEWLSRGLSARRAPVQSDRPMQGRQSPRAHRAENGKTKTQTISLAEGFACPGAPENQTPWS